MLWSIELQNEENVASDTHTEKLLQTRTARCLVAVFTAVIDFTSKWKLPSTPSAVIVNCLGVFRYFAVGHAEASSTHLTVGSPVVSDHLYEKSVKGIVTVWNSSEAGIAKFAL